MQRPEEVTAMLQLRANPWPEIGLLPYLLGVDGEKKHKTGSPGDFYQLARLRPTIPRPGKKVVDFRSLACLA